MTEFWLRGVHVEGVPPALQPVAHALLQALEDIEWHTADISTADVWRRAGSAASVGFHVMHMAGSLDRLLTYARGEPLSPAQQTALALEKTPNEAVSASVLVSDLRAAIDSALAQLRSTRDDVLDHPRAVGRAGLPSTVRGLLYHAGEHTSRHAGQVITTVRALRA